MKLHGISIVCAALLLAPSLTFAQTKRAFLVGINIYTPETDGNERGPGQPTATISPGDNQPHRPDSRFAGTIAWPNLSGPERDVENLASVLPDFGFSDIHRLTGQSATREAILGGINRYLIQDAKAGDTVLFYFAGHGSQRLNSKSSKLDHLDETIVPADAFKGEFDIRDKELARKFNQAIDKGLHVLAIFDSCHSGTMARGVKVGRARWLPYDDRDAADGGDFGVPGSPHADPPAQRGAIIVSAALSTQTADEIDDPATGAHGVFTSALIRALRSSTPAWTALDIVNSADAQLKADGWTQQPSVEGPANKPLFGSFTPQGIRATVVNLTSPDLVTLNVGSALGFGVDTEFASKSSSGLKLRVVEVNSAASSRAKIVSGNIADVHPGDLFEMVRLAVPPEAKLTVFIPAAATTQAWNKIRDQALRLHNGASWKLVDDPVAELPSNLVFWTPAGWTITQPQGGAVSIGQDLTSEGISKFVSNGATVDVSLPPTQSFLDALQQQSAISSGVIDISKSLANSQYLLIGRFTRDEPGAPQYALALPALFGALNSATLVKNVVETKSITCSTDSELPLRTDWSGVTATPDKIASAASQIEESALKLGRDRAWLRATAHNGQAFWPYRLTMSAGSHGSRFSGAPLAAGTEYEVELQADPAELASHVVQPQYVYVFGLQCDGAGTLLYPSSNLGGGAPLPLLIEDEHGKRYPQTIKLAGLQVAPPLGLDTIVLLVTPERISDLGAFNYDGVVTGGARGLGGELEDLVRGMSGQSRGLGAISATWSIQRLSIKSR